MAATEAGTPLLVVVRARVAVEKVGVGKRGRLVVAKGRVAVETEAETARLSSTRRRSAAPCLQ